MADGVKITTKGLDELINKLKQAPSEIHDEVDAVFENTAKEFVSRAKRDAPKDVGFLAGEINYARKGDMSYSIVSQSSYAGFLEFGTKKHYKAIPGFEDQAASIKGAKGGSAEDALKNIKAWVKRKGIRFQSAGTFKSGKRKGQNKDLSAEDTAYIIYHFIMLNGIKPHPYFFKQVEPAQAQLQKDLQSIVNILD